MKNVLYLTRLNGHVCQFCLKKDGVEQCKNVIDGRGNINVEALLIILEVFSDHL